MKFRLPSFVLLMAILGMGVLGCAVPGSSPSFTQRLGRARPEPKLHEDDGEGIVSFRKPVHRGAVSRDEAPSTAGSSRREILADAAARDRRTNAPAPSLASHPTTDSEAPAAGETTNAETMAAGHSSDQRSSGSAHQGRSPKHEQDRGIRDGSDVILAGHREETGSADETKIAAASNVVQAIARTEEPPAGDAASPDTVFTANYRSDRDATDNPVELQGFEAVASQAESAKLANPNEPSLWAHRPVAPQTIPHAARSRVPASPPDRVQQVSAQALLAVPAGPWQAELERLIAQAERDVVQLKAGSTAAQQAEYRRRQVHLRLLYLMAQRQEQALTAIPGLEPAEQEYWQQVCWAVSNSLDAEQFPSPRDRAAQSIAPLNTALRRLREQSDLTIRNMAFCEQISYFGNYQKFARDEFTPGQEVLLYAEIENFRSEQTADGEHRTLLRSVIDIVGAGGEVRWHKTFAATEDRCRNPRRDYFHNYQFAIPERLPLGPHTLKLTVVDDLSGKQASYSLNFLVK